jgi:hypothetical protein
MSVRRRSGFVVPLVFAGATAISIVLLACLSTDPAPEGADTSPPPLQAVDVFPAFETIEDMDVSLGDGPEGGALFDAGNMGDCSGFVAKSIPASSCGTCEGEGMSAYALCDGLLYSTCSCDLPPGYVLIDGGADSDGSNDAAMNNDAPEGAAMNDATPQDATADVTTTLDGASETAD